MCEKYLIAKIIKILGESDSMIVTEPCFMIIDTGFDTLELADTVRMDYKDPENHIIIKYWC